MERVATAQGQGISPARGADKLSDCIECKVKLKIIYSKTDSFCCRPSCRLIDQPPADCNKCIWEFLWRQLIINLLSIHLYLYSKQCQRSSVLLTYFREKKKKKTAKSLKVTCTSVFISFEWQPSDRSLQKVYQPWQECTKSGWLEVNWKPVPAGVNAKSCQFSIKKRKAATKVELSCWIWSQAAQTLLLESILLQVVTDFAPPCLFVMTCWHQRRIPVDCVCDATSGLVIFGFGMLLLICISFQIKLSEGSR